MSRYSSRSMSRLTASEPGHTMTQAVRPEAKRWYSAPVTSPSAGKFLQLPDIPTAHAYKARVIRQPTDILMSTSDRMREDLLMSFIRAYAHFGASLNTLEELMLDASRTLNIEVTVVRRHSAITCLIGERSSTRRYMRVVSPILPQSCFLGLLEVRGTYAAVVERKMRVPEARARLANLCERAPLRYPLAHLVLGALFSGLVCLAVFGGTTSDVLTTVVATLTVGFAHYFLRKVDPSSAEMLEMFVTIIISLLAHDSHTSSVLISVLPGYLYTCTALKRTRKYSMAEFIVAIFAATYTFALAHGLPVVLDLFLMTKLLALSFLIRKMWPAPVPARPAMVVRNSFESFASIESFDSQKTLV